MIKERMENYLPKKALTKIAKNVLNSESVEFKSIDEKINDIELQLSIDTATWGLEIYERELKIKTDLNKPYDERRSVIKSKWRGSGKVDRTLIKMVADAYTNGNVDVTFDGRIGIKFNGVYGVPKNLDDLKNALENIKPAQLRIIYSFAYILIKDIEGTMTLNDLQNTKLNMFAGGEI